MAPDLAPGPLPLLTAGLPGTGGRARVDPEDFLVEEIPAYLPCGEGEHLFVLVEKRDLTTPDAARLLAQAAGVDARDVGFAGQKDRRALTRQWMSFHTKRDRVESPDPRLRLVELSRHGNKLRVGHLRGNRFELRLRDVVPEATDRARAVLEMLSHEGLPNFFGAQRFGREGDNAMLGASLLGLCDHPRAGRARRDRVLRRLALSALQSELFNRCLADRMTDGLWSEVIDGDVLRRRDSGGHFVCTDPSADRTRLLAAEVDVTGPMPGPRERPEARGEARIREDRVLAGAGVPREALEKGGGETEGTRRPFRVPVGDARIDVGPDGSLRLAFALPAGSYATRVLAEVMKTASDVDL